MNLKKNGGERPQIAGVAPGAAIPGGELAVRGAGFTREPRPVVTLSDTPVQLVVSSDAYVVARVPENARGGSLVIHNGEAESAAFPVAIGVLLADGVHPVSNPAVDALGNVYTTLSGARGQKTPVAVYKIDRGGMTTPFVADLMNATGLAFDPDGVLHVSSRHEGNIYQVTGEGVLSMYIEGMGVATGIAFDREGNLFVGDRSGTVFKISRERQIYVFATVEPSIAAYHLAFGPDGYLYVTGPTTSSFDAVQRISPAGEVGVFYRGLGRPQGLAFDADGNLYVAGSLAGRRGIAKITPAGEASHFLSGPNIVGLAITPDKQMVVATTNSVFRVNAGVAGRPLP